MKSHPYQYFDNGKIFTPKEKTYEDSNHQARAKASPLHTCKLHRFR